MALNGDDLGTAINAARNSFNGLTIDQVNTTYGSIGAMRLAMAKAEGNAIVNYFKSNGVIVPGSFSNSGGPVGGEGSIE